MTDPKFAQSKNLPQTALVPESDSSTLVNDEKSSANPPGKGRGWFASLRRHPIFVVLVFVLASKIIGEFYPLSPYSMYSNPSSEPLRYCYVADGEGKPLPVQWHSGQTPARLTKKHRTERSVLEDKLEKASGRDKDDFTEQEDLEIRDKAGRKVLQYVIDLSEKRSSKRHLKPPLQLVEVAIGLDENGHLSETPRVVAELQADGNDAPSDKRTTEEPAP
jgi:hypothetical protein